MLWPRSLCSLPHSRCGSALADRTCSRVRCKAILGARGGGAHAHRERGAATSGPLRWRFLPHLLRSGVLRKKSHSVADIVCNADIGVREVREFCKLDGAGGKPSEGCHGANEPVGKGMSPSAEAGVLDPAIA